MPKLILRCNYLKNVPPSHLANYMNYISTREGVEKIDNTFGLLSATVKQKELIADILSKIEDADRMHEYLIISRGQQGRMRQSLSRRHWKTIWILLPRRKIT